MSAPSRLSFALLTLSFSAGAVACGSSGKSGTSNGTGAASPSSSSGSTNSGSASSGSASSGSTGTGGASSSSTGSSSSSSGGTDGGAYDPSVYQHHKNGNRDGLYIDAAFTQAAAAGTKAAGFMGTLTTQVYAQPLYVVDGPGGVAAFVTATEDNHVTTFNATTGAMIWDTGPTVIGTSATKNPPGGQIETTHIGITGTPFIDIGSRTIFFDAMVTPDNNATYHHTVFAISLDTGAVKPNWPVAGVDVSATVSTTATPFNSGVQNQRGALQFLDGVLYVPYGGYDGDGGNYWGSVVGFPVSNPKAPIWWHTKALKGGVWGPGALPTDGTNIYPVTGNTAGTNGTWGGGEAVIRLTPGPAFSGNTADYFTPTNWLDLDNGDLDLGGASEVLVDMPGAPTPHLVATGGKDGNLYLLDRDNLGGIGGQLLMVQVSPAQVKGAPATYTTAKGTYVALHIENGTGSNCPNDQQGNMVVMKITQSPLAATTAWCSSQIGLASPMVTTTDGTSNPIVWNASNALYGWDGDTGAVIVDGTKTGMTSAVQGWNTPIDANGKIAVAVSGQLYIFTP
jgi:hypothetical protein